MIVITPLATGLLTGCANADTVVFMQKGGLNFLYPPLMGIGVLIGARIHANMNTIAFRRLVALLLIFSGLPLLIR